MLSAYPTFLTISPLRKTFYEHFVSCMNQISRETFELYWLEYFEIVVNHILNLFKCIHLCVMHQPLYIIHGFVGS